MNPPALRVLWRGLYPCTSWPPLPPADHASTQVVAADPDLSRLRDLATGGKLTNEMINELKGLGGSSFTFFAPTNEGVECVFC